MPKLITKTKSLCHECLKIIDADIIEKNNKVFIIKECKKHGKIEELYWGNYQMYEKAKRFACDGHAQENPAIKKKDINCPFDCGLCKEHSSHSCLTNVVVTNRCDLNCWYCFFFAGKAGYIYEPTMKELRWMVRQIKKERPIAGDAIQITGGEPCLRDDLVKIIKMIKAEGFDHVQLNTDGIRLSQNLQLAKKISDAGVNTIYLSFDGVTAKTNPKNHWEVPGVLDNCRKSDIGIVLVPTVIKSVNDKEVGDIIRFGFKNNDVIRGVNFQPVSLVGRMPTKERKKYRITIPDVIIEIEKHTGGEISRDDFYPVPSMMPISHFVEAFTGKPKYELSNHFACGMATYLFNDKDRIVPITRFVDIEGLLNYLEEKSIEIKNGGSKYWVAMKALRKLGSFVNEKKQPKGIKLKNILFNAFIKHDYNSLGAFHHKSLFIGMMHFMDLYNYDIERVKRCDIHYTVPDKNQPIIPFCAFNVLPQLYRDKIQKKYGFSFKEWEKKTGKKMKDDVYKRSKELIASVPFNHLTGK